METFSCFELLTEHWSKLIDVDNWIQ